MTDDFHQYLLSRKLVPEKNVTFYVYWTNRYLSFSKRRQNADTSETVRLFLEDLQSRDNIADVMRDMVNAPKSPLDLLYEKAT